MVKCSDQYGSGGFQMTLDVDLLLYDNYPYEVHLVNLMDCIEG
jgi:hypothetical protein